MIDYDANGNQTEIREQVSDPEQPLGYKEVALRRHLWDEEDRLLGVDLNPEADPDKPEVAVYTYDAGGERSIRYIPGRFDAYYSAKEAGKNHRLEAILYPNSLVTVKTLPLPEDFGEIENVTITKYTKHYYIGSERVASALGSIKSLGLLCESFGADAALIQTMNNKVQITAEIIRKVYDAFEKDLELTAPYLYGTEYLRCDRTHYQDMYHPYWYHPDHLGSSSYITNLDGEINQHMEYLPFGELLVEEHLSSYNSPFKFNAKEFDAETGNYYYGARYYNPKWSIWLSVDPLALSYPNWSPYAYTYHNPVRWTDSTGMCPDGDCPDDANNGDMHTASDGNTYMHQFGRWSDAPVTDLGIVTGNKENSNKHNIQDAVPCVDCHHKATFDQGSNNQWDIFDLEKRQSGYVIYGGEMNSDFIGGTIGEDGVIYGSFDNLFAPSDQKTKIQFLKYLIDLKGGLEIGSQLGEVLFRGEEDIDFRTFNYTTYDTIPTKWSRSSGGRLYRGAYRIEEKKLKGYIINNDTIK